MIERTQDRFGTWPEKLVADAAYGSAENLAWLVHERGIEPHVPVFDKSQRRDGSFSRSDFAYDHEGDLYICPGGKELRQFRRAFAVPRDGVDREGLMRYRAMKRDCDACSLKPRCCPKDPARKLLRSIHEGTRDMARDIAATDAYATSRRERKKVEMLFAHLNASSGSIACGCEDHAGPATSSSSPPPPRTSGKWRSSCRRERSLWPPEAERPSAAVLSADRSRAEAPTSSTQSSRLQTIAAGHTYQGRRK